MRRARFFWALALGMATTLAIACVLPHLWYFAFRPSWSYPTWIGPPRSSSLAGSFEHQRRPLVDLYIYAPRGVVESSPAAGNTVSIPSWVRTSDDANTWTRIDTAGCGWPMRAMASEVWVYQQSRPLAFRWNLHIADTPDGPILIPMRPIWPGFVIDSLLFACAWFGVLLIPWPGVRWWREGRRLRRGHCPSCGYDLKWNLAPGCSECGWRRINSAT